MSSLKARALEGMLGGVLGGGVAGAGRAVFWEPKEPREWADQYGNIYDRPLTVEEKKARRQAVSQALLAGALGGAGASMGASALVGKRIAKVEREAAQEAVQDFLEPFRKLISDYKTELGNVSRWNPNSRTAQHMTKRVATAEKLLSEQEKVTDKLVDRVMERRAQLPFRGALHPADSGSVDWRALSAAHQVDKHFDNIAKQQGYPPIFSQPPRTAADAATAEDMAVRVFDRMVERAMTKTSAEAFWSELEKLAAPKLDDLQPGDIVLTSMGDKYTHKEEWLPRRAALPLAKLKLIESTG